MFQMIKQSNLSKQPIYIDAFMAKLNPKCIKIQFQNCPTEMPMQLRNRTIGEAKKQTVKQKSIPKMGKSQPKSNKKILKRKADFEQKPSPSKTSVPRSKEQRSASKPAKKAEPKKMKRKEKQKKIAQKAFLSNDQKSQFKEYVEELYKLGVADLKEMLQLNNQPKTGNKDVLIEKVADGKQFGSTPHCPACGGGRLRFDRVKGQYKCPGYMEDVDFKHCGKKYKFEEVKRTEWKEKQ